MKSSVVLVAIASYLVAAAPTVPSSDAPGLSKRELLPVDSIKARVSDDTINPIKARDSPGLSPDIIASPYYLVGELQE